MTFYSLKMRYNKTVALVALAAIGISALPLGIQKQVVANDLAKRNHALDVTDGKKYYSRHIPSSSPVG